MHCAAVSPSHAIPQLFVELLFLGVSKLCLHVVLKSRVAATYLVESLQQAEDAALDLFLVQASTSAVHPQTHEALDADGSSDGARSSHQSCSSEDGGSGNSGADGRGGCAEDGSAEHVGGWRFLFCWGKRRRGERGEEKEKDRSQLRSLTAAGGKWLRVKGGWWGFFGDRFVLGDDKFLSLAITRSIGGFPELAQVQRYKIYPGGTQSWSAEGVT